MAAKTPILLASSNTAKQDTLRWLLRGLSLSPVTPDQLGLPAIPEETGETHEAIARTKSQDWSREGSMLAVASDGGLVIPALGSGWESRYTHRFAGPAADDAQRLERLLDLMHLCDGEHRKATWVEAVAVADNGQLLTSWELQGATGIIANSHTGPTEHSGFWAFSIWYFPELAKTYNQLSLHELEKLGDHWVRLRPLVQDFFRSHLESIN